MATTVGPNGNTAANDQGGGGATWTNPGNAVTQNGTYASCVATGGLSNTLTGTSCGFSLPAGSEATAITVEVYCYFLTSTHNCAIGAVLYGTTSASVGTTPSWVSVTFPDIRGQGMTASIINGSSFGGQITPAYGVSDTLYVDAFRVTVTYGTPPTISSLSPNSGPVASGTSTTVTGTGFQNDTPGTNSITVNGYSATGVSVASDSSLTCTIPSGVAGTYNVVVLNNNGQGTKTNGWTWLSAFLPPVRMLRQAVNRSRLW